MNRLEQLLVKLDDLPWSAGFRFVLGWLIVPSAFLVLGEAARSWWPLFIFLIAVMFLIRLVPKIARAVLPFSQAALNEWGYRRGIGKRYDSYQWQKLLWLGLGMLAQTLIAGEFHAAPASVSLACSGVGFAGWIAWRSIDVRIRRRFDARPDRQGSLVAVATESTAR